VVFALTSILFGSLLVAAPIALHLALRQKPRQLVFPAIMFLKKKREQNRRQLRLKHWLLLALRCLAIIALVLALAGPSAASAVFGDWVTAGLLLALSAIAGVVALALFFAPHMRLWAIAAAAVAVLLLIGGGTYAGFAITGAPSQMLSPQEAPVAAAIVIDTSPRMRYRAANETRLEKAQGLAGWLLKELPDDSDVAIVSADGLPPVFAADIGAATATIESLTADATAVPLPRRVIEALDLLADRDLPRKELYIVTDLTAPSWPVEEAETLQKRVAAEPQLNVQVIDVGVEHPQNFALGNIVLASSSVPQSGELKLEIPLTCVGAGGEREVALWIEEPSEEGPLIVDDRLVTPEEKQRGRREVTLGQNGGERVRFEVRLTQAGIRHGRVTLGPVVGAAGVAADQLDIDDTRFFTVHVRPAWPVLLAGGKNANTAFVRDSLAPPAFRQSGRAAFDVTTGSLQDVAEADLSRYLAVALLDPGPLPESTWKKLAKYAEGGGAVLIALGRNADAASFSNEASQELLPGTLSYQWPRRRESPGTFVAPQSYQHPILRPLFPVRSSVPWRRFPVDRHWLLTDLSPNAAIVTRFANGLPAIVERTIGFGKVVVWTTPLSDAANREDRPWNLLPTAEDAWPFVISTHEAFRYLVAAGQAERNYLAGQPATLLRRRESDPLRYVLFTPGGGLQEVQAQGMRIRVPFTSQLGHYRLKPVEGGPAFLKGFSVNLPAAASDLTRIDRKWLNRFLGDDAYRLARRREEIRRDVGEARRGREFFPFLAMALAGIMAAEYVLANRFYRKPETVGPEPVALRRRTA